MGWGKRRLQWVLWWLMLEIPDESLSVCLPVCLPVCLSVVRSFPLMFVQLRQRHHRENAEPTEQIVWSDAHHEVHWSPGAVQPAEATSEAVWPVAELLPGHLPRAPGAYSVALLRS